MCLSSLHILFFFNDTATTEIYTLSLHDALPIFAASTWCRSSSIVSWLARVSAAGLRTRSRPPWSWAAESCTLLMLMTAETKRSEEHTSELQSHLNLVCRLLLAKN